MGKIGALLVIFFCFSTSTVLALPLEATAVKAFPVMKSEAAFIELLRLMKQDDFKKAAEYLKTDGKLMMNGTEVIFTEVGCDGQCVKFRVKGEMEEYWTVPTMDGSKVFEFKK
jgi:hypothetical protein